MFLYSHWVNASLATRQKIAKQFGIIKRGPTEVVNDAIKSDGYLLKEVEEALNIDAIQKFLETEETEYVLLWNMLIDKVEGREPRVELIVSARGNVIANGVPIVSINPPKKRGRPAKIK